MGSGLVVLWCNLVVVPRIVAVHWRLVVLEEWASSLVSNDFCHCGALVLVRSSRHRLGFESLVLHALCPWPNS